MKKRWTRTRQTLSAGLLTLVVVFAQLALAPTAGAAPKLAKGTVLLFSHPGAYSWIGHLAVGVKVDQSQNRYCLGLTQLEVDRLDWAHECTEVSA